MHLQVPAELRQTPAERDRFLYTCALAQMLHEIEPHAAEPERIEPLELGVSDCDGQERHAAVVAVLRLERVRDDRVVEPVAGGLDDHAMLDSQHDVQREEFFLRRVGGREGAVRGEGKHALRPEHVHVRVARARRKLELRPAGRGMEGRRGRHSLKPIALMIALHLACSSERKAAYSCGVDGKAMPLTLENCSRSSGERRAATAASWTRLRTAGRDAARFALVTASALNLPDWMCGSTTGMSKIPMLTCPPKRSATAGAAPL